MRIKEIPGGKWCLQDVKPFCFFFDGGDDYDEPTCSWFCLKFDYYDDSEDQYHRLPICVSTFPNGAEIKIIPKSLTNPTEEGK